MTIERTEELAATICGLIADGQSVRRICSMEGMPSRSTVLRWMADDPDFGAKCARAWSLQADALQEDMQDVADEATPEMVQVAKLRVATMQWRASKLAPKKYGDKLELAGDANNPVQVVIQKLT